MEFRRAIRAYIGASATERMADYKYGNISTWDVIKVTDMSELFSDEFAVTQMPTDLSNWDLSNWNVSNVRDMSGMFRNTNFNGNISKWNVSKVRDMSGMFENSPFIGGEGSSESETILNWNPIALEKMDRMFSDQDITEFFSERWNVALEPDEEPDEELMDLGDMIAIDMPIPYSGPRRPTGTSPPANGLTVNEILRNTDQYKVKSNSKNQCSICMDGYSDNNNAMKIKACGHEFHTSCLKQWLSQNRTCPLCRADVVPSNS